MRHLTATEIAAFIDHTLADDACRHAESHLAECSVCREELAACARLTAAAPVPRLSPVFPWRWAGAATAAALVAIVFTVPKFRTGRTPEGERARAGEPVIATIVPPPGTIQGSGVRFTWHSSGADVTYRLIVTDTIGTPVWSQDGADTSVVAPADTLRAGNRYVWRVEAIARDARVIKSASQSFTVSK